MRHSLLCLIPLLAACNGVTGDGHVMSDSRTVDSFRSVSIASGFSAIVTTGPQGVTIRADENLLPLLETFVQGDSLVVQIKPDTEFVSATTLEVAVSNDVLEGLDVSGGTRVTATATAVDTFPASASGGSHINLTGLASTAVNVDASGGSEVFITGTASHGTADASGGSTIDLTAVPLDSLSLSASGGSIVKAKVATSVAGDASGGSVVTISGSPTVNVDSSGGSVVNSNR
jgi:hypothetical protein